MSVIRRVKRRDGAVQRYHVKHLKRFRARYVYHRAAECWIQKSALRPKKPEPAPPPPPRIPTLWRLTLTYDLVERHHYYSVRLQAWSRNKEELERRHAEFEEELLRVVEGLIGYDREEWWWLWEMGEALQEVPFKPGLENTAEIEIEWDKRKSRKAGARGAPPYRSGVVKAWRWK